MHIGWKRANRASGNPLRLLAVEEYRARRNDGWVIGGYVTLLVILWLALILLVFTNQA